MRLFPEEKSRNWVGKRVLLLMRAFSHLLCLSCLLVTPTLHRLGAAWLRVDSVGEDAGPPFLPGRSSSTLLPAFIMLIVCVACGVMWVGTRPDIYLVWLGEVS